MFQIMKKLEFMKMQLMILITLTCIGILINSLDNFLIIASWWLGVFLILTLCLLWVGYKSAKSDLSIQESGINGVILWLVPGTIGLVISGITYFISSLLWGNIEGYEVIAFIGGIIAIIILLGIGAVISFILARIGSYFGQKR